MRIAVMTDAHANLPALEAALHAIRLTGTDTIYHTGDLIGIGPYPGECLQLALSTPNLRLTLGNHELVLTDGIPSPRPEWMSEGEEAHERWVAARIAPSLRAEVAKWPLVIEEQIGELRIALLHCALANTPERFSHEVRDASAIDLDRLFGDLQADLVLYGHTHRSSDTQGRARYVNLGALGCSSEAVARFVVLDVAADGTYQLTQHAVPYDDTELLDEFERRAVPDREFIIRNLLWRR